MWLGLKENDNQQQLFFLSQIFVLQKLKSMETSILTAKGQLLIPKRLRTKYGIEGGVKVLFEETDKGVLITPMNEQYFKSFAGILKSGDLVNDIN